jgi:Ran GTPase-activating protein (RanGAP) involved in mRNA processing and transport
MPNSLLGQVLTATTKESRQQMLKLWKARQLSKQISGTLQQNLDNRIRLRAKRGDPDTDGTVVDALESIARRGWILEALDLQSVKLSNHEMLQLMSTLAHCPFMADLNLTGNARSALGANALGFAIGETLHQCLRKLDLSDNNLDAGDAFILEEHLESCSALTCLRLDRNPLGNEGARMVFDALKKAPTKALQELHLVEIELKHEGVLKLAQSLPAWPALAVLDVTGNLIQNTGVAEIMATLPQCPSLTNLNLSSNAIDNFGAFALAEALERSTTLEILQLHGNEIRNDGFLALLKGAEKCLSLKDLKIDKNRISYELTLTAVVPGHVRVYDVDQLENSDEDDVDDDDIM